MDQNTSVVKNEQLNSNFSRVKFFEGLILSGKRYCISAIIVSYLLH